MAIVVGTFMSILDASIVNVAIPTLMVNFGATTTQVEWVSTAYMLVLGAVVPATGWLGDRFGLERVYRWSLAAFIVGSILCGLAWSLHSLIAFRVLQGIGAGIIDPVAMAMLYYLVPREHIGVPMGILGLTLVVGPALGPTVGGYIIQYVDWRLIFYINVPIGILGLALALRMLPRFPTAAGEPFDIWGFLTAAAGLFALLLAFSEAQDWGWGSEAIVLLLVGAAFDLAAFVLLELTVPAPLIDLRVFRYASFDLSLVLIVLAFTGLFAGTFYVPLYLQTVQGLGALRTGLLLMPPALVMAALMPVAGRIYDRIGARVPIVAGFLILAGATLRFRNLGVDTPLETILAWMMVRAAGMGLAMIPMLTAGLSAIPTEEISRASAVNNIFQRIAGAFGLAVLTTVLTGRVAQQAESLRWAASAFHAPSAQQLLGRDVARLAGLEALIQRLAFTGALADIFVIMAGIAALGAVFGLLVPGKRAGEAGAAHGPALARGAGRAGLACQIPE